MSVYKIEFYCGCTIDKALEMLQRRYKLVKAVDPELEYVYGMFNKWELRSDMTLDDAYLKIHGKTFAQVEEERRKEQEEYEKRKNAYKLTIPALKDQYILAACHNLGFNQSKLKEWSDGMESSLSSFYEDFLVRNTLEIISILGTRVVVGDEQALEDAKKKFDEQGHSGNTAGIVARWVQHFASALGDEFFYSQFPEYKERDAAIKPGLETAN